MSYTTLKTTPPLSVDGFTFDLQRFAFSGNGTEADPYQIATVADLQQLANDVNGGNNYSGVYFQLTADINLSSVENFTPIGNYNNHFNGTFDGDNKTISGLTIDSTSDYVGLFGYVDEGGTIKNVTLTNVNVSGRYEVGGVAGYNYYGMVTGNTVSGTVTGTGEYIGGVVGGNYGTVSGNTAISNVSGQNLVGGLVGYNSGGTVSGNTVVSTVNGNQQIGGLVGYNEGGGTISGNKFYSNKGDVGLNWGGTVSGNTQLYELTLPGGVSATGNTCVTVNGTTYAAGNITLAAKLGYIYGGTTSATVTANNTDLSNLGTASLDTANHYVFGNGSGGYTLATNSNVTTAGYPDLTQVYALTLPEGVTASGALLTDGNTAYVTAGNSATLTIGTGAALVGVTDSNLAADSNGQVKITPTADVTINANNIYYTVSVPSCVESVSGGTSTELNNTTYYQNGSTLTLTAKTGYTLNNTSPTVSSNTSISATLADGVYVFDDGNGGYTIATADNVTNYPDLTQVYALTLPEGVTVSGGSPVTVSGTTYYASGSELTLKSNVNGAIIGAATATGGNLTDNNDGTWTLTTTTAATEVTSTLYYALTLPDAVSVTGDSVKTIGGTTYAAGNITLSAAEGYTLQNVTVDGTTYDGNTLTVNAATTILADSIKFNNVNISTATGATVGGTTGNLSTFNGVYSITAAQENSTLVGNNNNNAVILEGGGVNILTGGGGNDTFKFSAGGGIVTDFGIGSTKDSTGKTLSAPLGSDVIKLDGKVSGVYFDRAASSKKTPTFTAIVTYDSTAVEGDDTQIIVLQNINKKPTKYSSDASKVVYQTNDAAAATLKIWDTSGTKQAILSAAKLKKLFKDDSELDTLGDLVRAKITYLGDIADGKTPTTNPFEQTTTITPNGNDNG